MVESLYTTSGSVWVTPKCLKKQETTATMTADELPKPGLDLHKRASRSALEQRPEVGDEDEMSERTVIDTKGNEDPFVGCFAQM